MNDEDRQLTEEGSEGVLAILAPMPFLTIPLI